MTSAPCLQSDTLHTLPAAPGPVAGVDVGNAQALAIAPAAMDVEDEGTGATQDMATLRVDSPPGLAASPLPRLAATSSTLPLPQQLLQDFVADEILQHFELVRAMVNSVNGDLGAGIAYPSDWAQLKVILAKLAFDVDTADPWRRLGLAMYEGPTPDELLIARRQHIVTTLASLSAQASWARSDQRMVQDFVKQVQEAAAHCSEELPGILRERKKLKFGDLPLYKELGPKALDLLPKPLMGPDRIILTQWSNIFGLAGYPPNALADVRGVSTLAEKGDAKLWDWTVGREVWMWAPSDNNAFTRCMASLLRLAGDRRPNSVKMIATIPLLTGMATANDVLDFWWHPLLGVKWTSLMRKCTFTLDPMEIITTGTAGPRLARCGLAVFHLEFDGLRYPPHLRPLHVPLFEVQAVRRATVDLQTRDLPAFMLLFDGPDYNQILVREPRRSPWSSTACPRLSVDLIFDPSCTDLFAEMLLRRLRRDGLPKDAVWGLHTMFSQNEVLILEMATAGNVGHYWELCTQMLAIGSSKAIVLTDANPTRWTTEMDRIMSEDASETHARLKWRPSRNGGRTVATPTATTAALAASRRHAHKASSTMDYVTNVTISGEIGKEDREVMRLLMDHLVTATNLGIKETDYSRAPRTGEYIHLASTDFTAPPGKVRILLNNSDEVRQVHAALHGQTIKAGNDAVGIVVENDGMDSRPVPGNGLRRRV